MSGVIVPLKGIGIRMPRTKYQQPKVRRYGRRPQVWRADWFVYDAYGKRHHRAATFGKTSEVDRADAQRECNERVQRDLGQTPAKHTDLTVRQLIEDVYLPMHTKWSPNTRLGFQSTINRHILPYLGAVRLRDLNKITLQKHLITLARKYGVELLKRVRTVLHAALEEAVDNDYIPKNPARKLEIPECRPSQEGRSLTLEETGRLFGSLSGEERLVFRVLILCGARIGEVLALKRDDILGGAIRFDESALFGKAGPTKNRKTRVVPISPSLDLEIQHWLSLRIDDNPLVFPGRRGAMMRREGRPLFILKRARKAAGIADLDYRMCRRTFSTLIEGDLQDVRDMLGHHSESMTLKHYKKAIPERQRRAVEDLERRISETFCTQLNTSFSRTN